MGKKLQGGAGGSARPGLSTQIGSLFDQGLVHHQSGQLAQAEMFYQKLLKTHPRHFEGLRLLGVLAHQTNRPEMAVALLSKALEVKPKSGEAYFNIGFVFQSLGQLNEALVSYSKAIALKPNFVDAHYNRGVVCKGLQRLNEALLSFDKVLALKPNFAEAHIYRGLVLSDLERLDEALASYDKAIALKPNTFEPHCNRALALLALQRPEEALVSFGKAIEIKPDLLEVDDNFLFGDFFRAKMMICNWQDFDDSLRKFEAGIRSSRRITIPFPVLSLFDSPELHKQAAKIYVDRKFPQKNQIHPIVRRENNDKIRLGYYSADFYNHATAYLMAELFETHDRTQFELFGFSFGPDTQDEMSTRVASAFDHFINVKHMSDLEIAKYSRECGIDIAIDLKGFTKDLRTGVFAERCAPIQVNYLGYPGTMSAEYMDYIIADPTVIPRERRSDYTEKVVYLPNSYQVNDSSRQISKRTFTRQECGLPESGFVFCCFNNNYKILPSTFNTWMRILSAVEGSVLWLLEGNSAAAKNLQKEADSHGVDSSRLVFAKRLSLEEHLARHRQADLFVDTLPYNAHTTASDALWAGLPVLTCKGKSFASRVSASLLNAVGLPELITISQDDYESKAVELALNREKLLDIKYRLQKNRLTAPLFNTNLFARHIESAYRSMYEKHQLGLEPESIGVH